MSTQIRDANVVSSGAPKFEKHMYPNIYFCTNFDTEYFPSQDFLSKDHPQFYTSFSHKTTSEWPEIFLRSCSSRFTNVPLAKSSSLENRRSNTVKSLERFWFSKENGDSKWWFGADNVYVEVSIVIVS